MLKLAITRLAKGSIVYGIGGMLQRFMGLLLLPFFTQVLTPADYGVVALVSLISIAMSGLFTLGTGNSIGVIYFREQDPVRHSTIIWSNILLMVLNGLFWCVVLFFAAPTLSEYMFQTDLHADLIRLGLLGSVLMTIAAPFLSYLRMEEKAKQYVMLTLGNSILTIGLSVWFVLIERIGVTGIILAGTLSQGIMLLVNWAAVGRYLRFKIDISLFWRLVRIGFPSIFGVFAFLLIDYADRQMIERMVSIDALGVYSVGYSFGVVIIVATGAFASAWPPFSMSYINKREEARIVFARVLTYYCIGFGGLIVLIYASAKPIVLMMTAPAFYEAYLVVGLIAASYMLKGCYLIMLPGLCFAEKLYKQSIVEWVAAIVNIGLNLWLIPIYGIIGAAMATFISYLTLPVLAWSVARRYLAVDYEWDRIAWTSILVLCTSSFLYFFSISLGNNLLLIIVVNSVVLIGFCGVVYRLLLTVSERKTMWEKLRA